MFESWVWYLDRACYGVYDLVKIMYRPVLQYCCVYISVVYGLLSVTDCSRQGWLSVLWFIDLSPGRSVNLYNNRQTVSSCSLSRTKREK